MSSCQDVKGAIHRYLDRNLQPEETHAIEAHLVDCDDCRHEYESLLVVVESVRAAHPLYPTPPESYANARRQIQAHRNRTIRIRTAIAASLLIAGLISLLAIRRATGAADPFAGFAAETHIRYSRGTVPLDIRSTEPQVVAAWLTRRLPFHLDLPDYPGGPGQKKKYTLIGARLAQYEADDVAYLAYEMQGRPISLLVGSSSHITPAGGELYRAGGLTFHMTTYKGLSTITWVDHGLSYALVSDLKAVGAESCVICHGAETDRGKFAPLKPRS